MLPSYLACAPEGGTEVLLSHVRDRMSNPVRHPQEAIDSADDRGRRAIVNPATTAHPPRGARSAVVLRSSAMTTQISADVRSELVSTGHLRVGLNHGNFLLVTPGSRADPRGVAPDVARELGRRVDAPVEFVNFDT